MSEQDKKRKVLQEADICVELVRSSRKSLVIQIGEEATVVVRAPLRMPEDRIRSLIREKSSWILEHEKKMKKRMQERKNEQCTFSEEQLEKMREQARRVIPGRVAYFAPLVGVTYGRITIRDQKTRWGSCSGAGNLNFNFRLVMAPSEVLDYVVVHELCHRRQMNHSELFWDEVSRILPDYRQARKWLKQNGWRLTG